MTLDEFQRLYNEYFYYFLMLWIGLGLLFGLVPLILGIRRNKRHLGFLGFILAGAVGALSPVLSFILAAIFVFLVLRRTGTPATADAEEIPPPESSE